MAFVNFMFNSVAAQLLQDRPNVRIRVREGRLQFRPTTRKSQTNLPKGERLREICRTRTTTYFSVKEDFLESDTIMCIEEVQYGWYTAFYTDGVDQKTMPTARLTNAIATDKKPSKGAKRIDAQGKHVNLAQ